MGKTRDFLKKIKDTKGAFLVKMGSIKDRNGMDLTEAKDIKEVARITKRKEMAAHSRTLAWKISWMEVADIV